MKRRELKFVSSAAQLGPDRIAAEAGATAAAAPIRKAEKSPKPTGARRPAGGGRTGKRP